MQRHFDIDLQLRGTLSSSIDPADTVSAGPPPTGERIDDTPAALTIRGTVRDAAARIPLGGVQVAVHAVAARNLLHAAEVATAEVGQEIARTTTAADGSFLLRDDNGEAWAALRAQVAQGEARVMLRAGDAERPALTEAHRLRDDGLQVELMLPRASAEIGRRQWLPAARALGQAGVEALPQVLVSLRSQAQDGPFSSWSDAQRLVARDTLERAFLDPGGTLQAFDATPPGFEALAVPGALESYVQATLQRQPDAHVRDALADYVGKARSFDDLEQVDWRVDVEALGRGDATGAVTRFADRYRKAFDLDAFTVPFRLFVDTDLTRYRDYLREIWVSVAQLYEPMRDQRVTPQQAADQLRTRFHQDFHQKDTLERPANEICIDILREILTAGTGTQWGFGLSPDTLPVRGEATARAHLDALIAASGVSAGELALRYRIDFERPDSARSSRVRENIGTLQAFFRDGFQARPDAFGTDPNVHGQPIVPPPLQGRAPFFLWYDEWLRQQAPFHPENHFDFRRAFPAQFPEDALGKAQALLAAAKKPAEKADWQLIVDTILAANALRAAHTHYHHRQYALADQKLDEAWWPLWRALGSAPAKAYDIRAALAERRAWKVTKMSELDGQPPAYGSNFTVEFKYLVGGIDWQTREATRNRCAVRVYYWLLYVFPLARADVALARGDHARAAFFQGQVTRFRTGTARESDAAGYRPHYLASSNNRDLYHLGDRPYSADIGRTPPSNYPLLGDDGSYYDTTTYSQAEQLQAELLPASFHPIEIKAARLRHGNTLLEWADALYRTDEASSIQRARELYKAVLYLHGAKPPISSSGPLAPDQGGAMWMEAPFFLQHQENPAVRSQKARARAGFHKISLGLNWYGETDDAVPVLRYRELKEIGDRFAALAKATQQDFLQYTGKVEASMIDRMRLANLIQKGEIQVKLTEEQRKIAEHGVQVADAQVKDVEAAITAKRKEIEDSEGFFDQLGDFLGGMVSAFKGLPSEATGFMASGAKATFANGAAAGAAAGLGVMGGYAAFVYAGYTSLSAMADEYASLRGQFNTLRDKALPAAQAQRVARAREVTIAGFLQELAMSDIALARDLLTFEERRFLSLEFWSELSRLMVRLLRRYLELAARTAWLAERALSHEIGRPIDIVRFDYFPEALQGVTGADLLLADLAELEAIRVEGTTRTVPARVTLSLAAQFPLAFGQLKKTGRCSFATTERWLRDTYPGTHTHRVRAVNARVLQEGAAGPVRGILVNAGISVLGADGPAARGLVRPAEGLPISEFRLDRDLAVHGLPDGTLFAFEGSGIETFWQIELPLGGNAASLASVADVLVTFDLRAMYDPLQHAAQNAAPPTAVRRWVLMSAQRFAPQALATLAAGGATGIAFDFTTLGLSDAEQGRTVTNLALAFVADAGLDISVGVQAAGAGVSAQVPCTAGIAHSNLHPDPAAAPQPPMALNALAGTTADQTFVVDIDPAAHPGAPFASVRDLLFAIEYTATVG